jgi:hypothetical protein
MLIDMGTTGGRVLMALIVLGFFVLAFGLIPLLQTLPPRGVGR